MSHFNLRSARFARLLALSLAVFSQVALPQMSSAQSANPQAVSMYNLGLNAFKQGTPESAIIFFRRALVLDPNLADAQYNLGVLYQSQRRHKEALPCFQEVLRLKPTDPDAHFQMGRSLLESGKPQEAKEQFLTIAPNSRDFAEAQRLSVVCDQKMINMQGSTGAQTFPAQYQPTQYQSQPQYQPQSQYQPQAQYQPAQYQPAPQNQSPYQPVAQSQPVVQQNSQPIAVAQPISQPAQQIGRELVASNNISSTDQTGSSLDVTPQATKPAPILANATVRVIATGFNAPSGLTFDKFGNLYVANFGANTIDKIGRDGTRSIFSTGGYLRGPIGLVSDDSGNIYVANYKGGTIVRITPAGIASVIATGFRSPYYLTLDKSGNLFVSQQEDNSIIRVSLPQAVQATSQK